MPSKEVRSLWLCIQKPCTTTESVIYAAVFLGVFLGCSALFAFSHNRFLIFQDIAENQSWAHEENNSWVDNHCVISVKKRKEFKLCFGPGSTSSLVYTNPTNLEGVGFWQANVRVIIKCKMWFYTNQMVSCKLLLSLCLRTSQNANCSVPTIILQVVLQEGSFKSHMTHIRHIFYSSPGLCQSKISHVDESLNPAWALSPEVGAGRRRRCSQWERHGLPVRFPPPLQSSRVFSCSSCFSSFPRRKQPVDPGTRGLTHSTSRGWSCSISVE